jgi:uncharacterized membrane protein
MNFPDRLFPAAWSWWALLPLAFCVAWAIRGAPWRRLADSTQLHGWLGTLVLLMLLWRLNAGVRPGLSLHFLGATTLTLMFGRELAIIGLAIVLAGVTAVGDAGWTAYPLNALVLAVLPPFLSEALRRQVEQRLPPHIFVYIFVAGFFGAALTVALTGLAATLMMALAGIYPLRLLFDDYYPYYALLGFAEAWMNGAAITLLVVYFPHWVGSFDDRRYLRNK